MSDVKVKLYFVSLKIRIERLGGGGLAKRFVAIKATAIGNLDTHGDCVV